MIEYCRNRLFPHGFPTKSMLAVTRDDFVTAGEVMAMSVVQGGPSPNFLAREIYNVVIVRKHCHAGRSFFIFAKHFE